MMTDDGIVQERCDRAMDFVYNAIGYKDEKSLLGCTVYWNDDSDPDMSAFEIRVSNSTNDNTVSVILGVGSGIHEYYILEGEEFQPVDHKGFLLHLFYSQFITFIED